MSLLTEYPSRWVRYGGHQIRMCCSYDNVLEVQRLYRDAGLSDLEKADQALVMLTGSPFRLWLMGEGDKIQLLNKIYEEQIRIPKKPPWVSRSGHSTLNWMQNISMLPSCRITVWIL